jgi:hypothetical protein
MIVLSIARAVVTRAESLTLVQVGRGPDRENWEEALERPCLKLAGEGTGKVSTGPITRVDEGQEEKLRRGVRARATGLP